MKILITGANGFVGKNLTAELKNRGYNDLFLCDVETTKQELAEYTAACDFVFHLAGVNRPEREEDFMTGNFGFTSELLEALKNAGNTCPLLITSSIQAELENPYGRSKKAGEDLIVDYGKQTGAKVMIYRLTNVFGKWCRPNYNSAVATFCHNIARSLPITVNNRSHMMHLIYIDDLIDELVEALKGNSLPTVSNFYEVKTVHWVTLGEIADMLSSFHQGRKEAMTVPNMSDGFTRKLYSTYLSYLPENNFAYDLKMNIDERGSFAEFIKTPNSGQVSVNISKPGITKGNHWHHTKNEKFLVVSGRGVIRFRRLGSDEIIEYKVSGNKPQVVDIPPGYTHNITNIGDCDMVTVMWANEIFTPKKPDTYYLEV